MMEEGEEEQDLLDFATGHDFADATMDEPDEDELPEEACPIDDLGQILRDVQKDCESVKEFEALQRILDDHHKLALDGGGDGHRYI